MKIICLCIAVLIVLQCKAQQAENSKTIFNSTKKIEIEGKINHYNSNNDNRFISFVTYNIFGRTQDTAVFIEKGGSFTANLFQPYEGEILVLYKDEGIKLYTSPGEKIKLTIDDVKWKPDTDLTDAITLSGKSASTSKEIVRFQFQLKNQKFKNQIRHDKEQTDKDFAVNRIALLKEELNFLSEYIKNNKIRNEAFRTWAENNLTYNAGQDISYFPFTGKLNTSLTDSELIELLGDIPIDNSSALHNSSYYSFLESLSGSLQIIVNLNKRYDELKKQNGMNATLVYLDLLNKYSNGIARQLMYYEVYRGNAHRYKDLFTPVISDSYLGTLMQNDPGRTKPFEPFNVVERLKAYKADDSLKARLIQIFNQQRDKYIFIDFWGDWCAPCMREMPNYPKLIEEFKGSNINFLFFAVDTPEEKVLETKKKYGVEGQFITLSDNETNILNNVLQFHSYPSHFLIQPNGVAVDNEFHGLFSADELNKKVVEKIYRSVSTTSERKN